MSVKPEVAEPLIVADDQEDVGASRGGGLRAGWDARSARDTERDDQSESGTAVRQGNHGMISRAATFKM